MTLLGHGRAGAGCIPPHGSVVPPPMGRPPVSERVRSVVSRGKGGARVAGALVSAVLMHALRGLAAILEGAARLLRAGARQLERASAGVRLPVAPTTAEAAPPPA